MTEPDLYQQDLVTAEERPLLAELSRELESDIALTPGFPEVVGELNLLRFLRGNDRDIVKAAAFFRSMLAWRTEFDVDKIRQRVVRENWHEYFDQRHLPHAERVLAYYPERFFHGADKRGNPIMISSDDFNNNISGLMANVTPEDYIEYRIARAEAQALLLHALSENQGRLVKLVHIWDLKCMTMGYWGKLTSAPCEEYRAKLDQKMKHCYPESVFMLIAVNTPWFLEALWKPVSLLLPKRTLAKISINGQDYLEALREVVDTKNLPVCLGGPEGAASPAGWNPEVILPVVGHCELQSRLELRAGKREQLEYVLKAGSTISWKFRPTDNDVGFEAKMESRSQPGLDEPREQELVAVLAYRKYQSDAEAKGSFMAEAACTLRLEWDNSYSYWRGKTVQYEVLVSHCEDAQKFAADAS
ncbi:hypothetical protein CYMTET_54214 [Cymbomonas tetramitiformis]|uniref:CRAL-TRIO domain-containing protein n=1 Tax=Cymbomonas tetramitiformis TaxID=36881 RepID=A0AAE0BFJ9_9CHLO|nr:hypothetical protein CYMTET_54214 [Cymbomonas tetramitiformis]|eukprot:gene2857-3655_t